MKLTKKNLHKKNKSLKHRNKYPRKTIGKKFKNLKSNKNKKYTKRYKKFRKNMKGGIATFSSSNSTGNVGSVPIGNGKFSMSTYSKGDTPSLPPSAVSYIPSPVMDLKWSIDSGLRNFFNEIFGQPRQFTSSPTDQPIGEKNLPITPNPLTSNDLNNIKTSILSLYSQNANSAGSSSGSGSGSGSG